MSGPNFWHSDMANYAARRTYRGDGDTNNPHLSLHLSGGLMQNFIAGTKFPPKKSADTTSEEDEEVGVELSLGLSLNGRFGVDPTSTHKNFVRSSSNVPDFFNNPSSTDEGSSVSVTWTPIMRTSSLPMEESRKRKQMQSLRRMEAKRKRTEKQQSNFNKKQQQLLLHHNRTKVVHPGRHQLNKSAGNDNVLVGSQGSGSSGLSEFDSHSIQEEGSPSNQGDDNTNTNTNTMAAPAAKHKKESSPSVMVEMPLVSTRGGGGNGRRIEGFLYRKKGEEVKIVCVCHGSFLSPAEFVKHAGGDGDTHIAHPLKHIIVTPSPFASTTAPIIN